MSRKDISDLLICSLAKKMWPRMDKNWGPVGDPLPDQLRELTGECEKVCWAALHRAADRDLIGYGVSIKYPWLTESGEALLADKCKNTRSYTEV